MRSMILRCAALACAAVTAAALDAPSVSAGGPANVFWTGQVSKWPNGGRGIRFRPDQGRLGPLSHEEAVALTEEAFGQWQRLSSTTATFVNGGVLPMDVDATNAGVFLYAGGADGLNPIVYDDDGSITANYFGRGAAVLGFGSIALDPATGDIADAWIVLNGRPYDVPVARSVMLAAALREIGEFSGLDFSQVNGVAFHGFDTTGPSPHETFPRPAAMDVETMFFTTFVKPGPDGTMVLESGQDVLHRDDIAAFSALYPAPEFRAETGTITGRILTPNGTPYTGVNVIARNVDDPFDDAVSSISGALSVFNRDEDPRAGEFVLTGLTPGARYAVYADRLIGGRSAFGGLPGPEEFYNGDRESNDPATDDPGEFVPVVARAGETVDGIDIVFNAGGPRVIAPDDWGSMAVPLFPRLPLEMCGRRFGVLWVNQEATLYYGLPQYPLFPGDLPSAISFLGGRPTVAGLWAALVPSAGGTIAVEDTDETLRIAFTDVPGPEGGSNSFTMTLTAEHGRAPRWRIEYGDLDETGGLAGYSCGELATSQFETETDLTAFAGRTIKERRPAVFEEFTAFDNDLADKTITYELPGRFADVFEPNDSIAAARPVSLPFTTASVDNYADISLGNVDVYRFKASRGEILVAETVRGNFVDTAIELYRIGPNGRGATLLASNDDFMPHGFRFSRIILTVPEDGHYALSVTGRSNSLPTDPARYVLNITAYSGRVLPLGDDDSVEVPLPFPFPYQGARWSSVWVNSDGNLTFGAPEPQSSRSVFRFLNGPPRIAPLFADLDPTGSGTGVQGLVIAEEGRDSVTVHWASVPRFFGVQPNSFSVTLRRDGTLGMRWGALDQSMRAVVGITEGRGALDPRLVDLSRLGKAPAAGTTFEFFFFSLDDRPIAPMDLFFGSVTFGKPGHGDDEDEDHPRR